MRHAAAAALCLWNDGDFTHVCTACFARETFFHAEKTIERVAKLHNQGTEIWDCAQWAAGSAVQAVLCNALGGGVLGNHDKRK